MKNLFSASVIAVVVFLGSTAMSTCVLDCRNRIEARFVEEHVPVGPSFLYCEAYETFRGGKQVKTDYGSEGNVILQTGQTKAYSTRWDACSQSCWTPAGATLNNVEAVWFHSEEDIQSTYFVPTGRCEFRGSFI